MAAYGSVRQSDRRYQGLEVVEGFRSALYGCATRRADAWFELGDALLVTERLVSLPHRSLEPLHRRGHGSLDAALRHGGVAAERLRELLAAHLPGGPPAVAVDPTVWARCDAECSQVGVLRPPLAALGRPADRGGLVLPAGGGRGVAA